jgi:NhaA family Na+:H+ antiporter
LGVTLLEIGILAGIGFTMPVFVATLSFEGAAELLTEVKASIMLASSIAGLAGGWIPAVSAE